MTEETCQPAATVFPNRLWNGPMVTINYRDSNEELWCGPADSIGDAIHCCIKEWQPLKRADLAGANLSHLNLMEVNLSESDLSRTDLRDSWLNSANLANAVLINADLSNANCAGIDLSDAVLKNAKLINTSCAQANLSGADLSGADVSGATFFEASIERAKLDDATWYGVSAKKIVPVLAKLRRVRVYPDRICMYQRNFDPNSDLRDQVKNKPFCASFLQYVDQYGDVLADAISEAHKWVCNQTH